jgi:phosphate transport system substrate-binding protein
VKRLILTLIALSMTMSIAGCGGGKPKETVTLSGAFALYPMAVRWAEEYKKLNPQVEFDITAGGAGKGMADALSGMVDLGMVSREVTAAEIGKGAYPVSVAIDAVIPVMSTQSPAYAAIAVRGLKKDEFKKIWEKNGAKRWNQVAADIAVDAPINAYTRSDACGAAQTWGGFFSFTQEQLNGVGVFGDPGIAEAVRKDVNGVGYNNINFAYDRATKKPVAGLAVIPIDINGNGKIDAAEAIYGTREELTGAIAAGVFPSPPARKLYFVAKGERLNPRVRDFLRWVMADGQKYVQDSGYILLLPGEVSSNLEKLGK